MARERKKPEGGDPGFEEPTEGLSDQDEIHDEDFQFALKELLGAYEPLLAEELERARAPEELKKEALAHPPSCDDELELAARIFDRFFTEEVAVRLLPPEGREQLGPVDRWRWCLLHIRCCIIFGWLVCRGPRTFRAFAYYLFRYWLCVRQALGDAPIGRPLTEEEREDFATLVRALAGAYKPYLADELSALDLSQGLPDEIVGGKVDCEEGEEESAAIFERLLTVDIAPALLGRKVFEEHSHDPNFWFCRCWCLCAIRFGCCLARARNLIDVLRCLLYYRRCLRECFRPIRCELTAPTGCAEEQPGLPGLPPGDVGLEIVGTAVGAFFDHYTLEWREAQGRLCNDNTGWSAIGISYPGGGATGTSPVNTGVLGVLDTTVLQPRPYEIRLSVYSTQGAGVACQRCIEFALFKKLVWISRVTNTPGAPVQTPPGPFDGTAPIVSGNPAPPGVIVPVGGSVSVLGSAFVGECDDRKIKCVDLRAALDWQVGPEDGGFAATIPLYTIPLLLAPICYTDPSPVEELKRRASWNQLLGEAMLTARWQHLNIFGGQWWLKPQPFASGSGLPVGVNAGSPPCPDPHHRYRSGKYTLLLDVTDTNDIHYYDTQRVWFDNKLMSQDVHVRFEGIEGLPGCTDMSLIHFAPPGAPCGVAWDVNLLGVAYDEYIDETDLSYPSDNFDFYSLSITKQGGPTLNVPISVSPDPGNALHGISRRGQPGMRWEALPVGGVGCPPAEVVPGPAFDVLTALDMRVFDAVCAGSVPSPPYSIPSKFPLERGTCCGYAFQLYAQDKTWSDGTAGALHRAWSSPWAVCICNDIDRKQDEPFG